MFGRVAAILVLAATVFATDYVRSVRMSAVKEPVQWTVGIGGGSVVLLQDMLAEPAEMQVAVVLSSVRLQYADDNGAINASIAAAALDGVTVGPGKVFFFNSAVGPRTVSKGYVEGVSVVRTGEGFGLAPDIGGGVCRTATALHMAVQAAELEVVEHHTHGLPVGYAPPGKDAAVAWPDLDYRFRNVLDRDIIVKASSGRDFCEVQILEVF